MRYASKVAMCRVQIPKLAYDNNTLEFWYTGNGSATFDPGITTGKSTTIVWQTSDGQNATTTGTSHAFSYTPASGGPYRCTARVNGGLGLVTAIDCNSDSISSIKNLSRIVNLATFSAYVNAALSINVALLPRKITSLLINGTAMHGAIASIPSTVTVLGINSNMTGLLGNISDLPPLLATFYCQGNRTIAGSIADLPTSSVVCYLFGCLVTPGSIAHLTAIRDIRIYSMGWTTAQNTTVLLSAWNARASYTYASNIALRISAPTGTPGTEPPAVGVSNDDWSWNAGTSRHDPLTGYAVISDLQTDFYSEGFNPWVVTIV